MKKFVTNSCIYVLNRKGGRNLREFKQLYNKYAKELLHYLLHLTNDRSLAEELVQETFYQAYLSIHRFKGKSKVKTWVFQIAKHVYYKELKKNPSHIRANIEEAHLSMANLDTPDKILQEQEQQQFIHTSILALTEPYKQVVILRIYSELSFYEIGEILEKSENWARVTFHRGKQKLQMIMKREENK